MTYIVCIYNIGDIITLMSVDMERIWGGIMFCNWVINGPTLVIGSLVCLSFIVGYAAALTAAANCIIVFYIFWYLGKQISYARGQLVIQTENRMKLINESLQGIYICIYL